jgi:superoxide dismutase, Cu-Zn family
MSRWKMLLSLAASTGLVVLSVSAATARQGAAKAAAAPMASMATSAEANFSEGGMTGVVHFTQMGKQVRVTAEITGATPGQHGFHIHEKGLCTPPDFKSAGGHFNPGATPHACMPTMPRHPGDFGNITVGADQKGHLDVTVDTLSMSGADSIIGRSVIFHKGTDDCVTQPTGNSGDRSACAVINAVTASH